MHTCSFHLARPVANTNFMGMAFLCLGDNKLWKTYIKQRITIRFIYVYNPISYKVPTTHSIIVRKRLNKRNVGKGYWMIVFTA